MKNLLASIAAASIVFAAVVANAAPVAPTPPAAACAKRTVIDTDGTIHIVSRCVIVSK